MRTRELFEEGQRMQHFGHPRLMQLIGIAFDQEFRQHIVSPFMRNGNLESYLKDHRNVS